LIDLDMLGHLHLLPPPDLSQTLPHSLRHQVVRPLIIITWGVLVLIFNEGIVLLEGQSLLGGLGA
jgi:hypothetical protein